MFRCWRGPDCPFCAAREKAAADELSDLGQAMFPEEYQLVSPTTDDQEKE